MITAINEVFIGLLHENAGMGEGGGGGAEINN